MTASGANGAPIKVLLVDDSADLRLVVRKALERHGGFEVVAEASDGSAAIELAAAALPDMVLLDLAMPGLDGFGALPRLRAILPSAKVVVLSGLPPRGAESRARSAGAVGFLEKGIPSRRLVDELIAIAGLVEVVESGITEHRTRLQRDTTAPNAARRFVEQTLNRWQCGARLDDVRLLVSELVTNALVHASSEADVAVLLRSDAIRVEVADDSTDPPVKREAMPGEPGGRGLGLVEALSTSWGFDVHDNGKVVWFEVPRLDTADPRAG